MSNFIDQIATGDALGAKNTMSDMLSAKAFESLDARKQELAASLFGGSKQEESVEELDELSTSTLKSYISGAQKDRAAQSDSKNSGDREQAAYAKKQSVKRTLGIVDAKARLSKEEVEQVEEGTMTGITLGAKVKNKQGGYNQDVHHKGEKIGHIEAYKHRTGMRYGAHHDASGDVTAGNRDAEESIADIRFSHAEHLRSMKK